MTLKGSGWLRRKEGVDRRELESKGVGEQPHVHTQGMELAQVALLCLLFVVTFLALLPVPGAALRVEAVPFAPQIFAAHLQEARHGLELRRQPAAAAALEAVVVFAVAVQI